MASGDVWLKKGASWQGDNEVHHLSVDNLTAHLSHDKQSWAFYIPDTRIAIDDKPWPSGALAMAWIPAQDVGGDDRQRSDELRIRASNLALSGLSGLQPFADKLAPSLGELWRTTQPGGKINLLALDIPPAGDGENAFSGAVERSGVEAVETPAGGRALLRQSEWQR